MEIATDNIDGHQILSYGEDFITINGQTYQQSLIVTPAKLIEAWQPDDLTTLIELAPQVILLGMGLTSKLPSPEQLQQLADAHIGFEWMTTAAACRTYNLLAADGRKVAAGLTITR